MAAPFVCPRCRACVARSDDAYECAACRATYPIVLGIPDFRVAPDPWIGMEEDRAKGLALERQTEGQGLEAMVRAYWAMTPETPRELAKRFTAHVVHAEQRSREWVAARVGGAGERPDAFTGDEAAARIQAANSKAREQWLDIGCGAGDFAAAAAMRADITSIDVAFRWLVVARRRLLQQGLPKRLVCCNAEALPFADAVFDRAWSSGTIEHVAGQREMLRGTNRALQPGGTVHLRTVNRFSLLPEPHVGVLGVGWLPRKLADRWVRWRTGQRYLHHRLLSANELRGLLRDAGFASIRVEAAQVLPSDREQLANSLLRLFLPAYETARRITPLSRFVGNVSPLIEARAVRRS